MSGIHMKIMVAVLALFVMAFTLPTAFADAHCTIDSTDMTLTPLANSITVTWTDGLGGCTPDTITEYDLTLFLASDPFVVQEYHSNVASGFLFEDLEYNTEYSILLDVFAIAPESEGFDLVGAIKKTVRTQAETITEPVDPECIAQPPIISAEVTDTTIELSWTAATQCVDGLEVEPIVYFVAQLWNGETFRTNELSMLIEGLTPETEYEFVVIAEFDNVQNQFVEITLTTDETEVEEPNQPCESDITAKNIVLTPTDTTITVEFDPAFECKDNVLVEIEWYHVLIKTDADLDTIPDKSGHIFEGLVPNTEYHIVVVPIPTIPAEVFTVSVFVTTLDVDATPIEILEEIEGAGCSGDCTPPTIGLDENSMRIVENGFSYNNNPVDVIAWHTPYPLITAIVNQTNTVEIIAYDNGGIFNLDMIQFGLGFEEFGQSLHDVEVLIEVHLEALVSENKVIVEKVIIRDRDNLIDTFTVFAVTETVDCADDGLDNDCLKVTLEYSYREATINNMMGVNVVDRERNTQNFYLNDGVEVIGESMNPTPFVVLPNKQTSQQTENLTKTLFRTDKVNHIWMDGNGVEYLKTGDNKFDRITPPESYTCNDPPLSEINVPTRSNCNFRALTAIWDN